MFGRPPAARAGGGARRRPRCGATPSPPMAARAPDLPLWLTLLCALRKTVPFSPFFPLRARARGERRFQTATAISFLCLAGRQPLVPAAERDADRAAELRRRRRWPPGPPICPYASRCCARSGKRCPLVLSFPFARAREASADSRRRRRFLFYVWPADSRSCRRQSATPPALRCYAVAADGRPGPRSAAMAHAAVRAQENGAL